MTKNLIKSFILGLIIISLSSCSMICKKCAHHEYKHDYKSKKDYKSKTCSKHDRKYKNKYNKQEKESSDSSANEE